MYIEYFINILVLINNKEFTLKKRIINLGKELVLNINIYKLKKR